MMVFNYEIAIMTEGFCDIHDLTGRVNDVLGLSGIENGIVTIFVNGSTAGITTCEYEPGQLKDLKELFESLVPSGKTYHHDAAWGDGNGFSHLRASLLGPSLSVPIVSGRLILGRWQQIILIDFDNRSRKRTVVMQFIGD